MIYLTRGQQLDLIEFLKNRRFDIENEIADFGELKSLLSLIPEDS